jgi:hypothetical protein
MNEQEQKDVVSLLIRVLQVDAQEKIEHFVWQTRIIECDVPRLSRYITDPKIREILEEMPFTEDILHPLQRYRCIQGHILQWLHDGTPAVKWCTKCQDWVHPEIPIHQNSLVNKPENWQEDDKQNGIKNVDNRGIGD